MRVARVLVEIGVTDGAAAPRLVDPRILRHAIEVLAGQQPARAEQGTEVVDVLVCQHPCQAASENAFSVARQRSIDS